MAEMSSSEDSTPPSLNSRAPRRRVRKVGRPCSSTSGSEISSSEDSSLPSINSRAPGRRVRKVGRPSSSTSGAIQQLKTVYESRRRPVSEIEIQRAQDEAAKFEMENRCLENMFLIQMTPTHVYHDFHLTIPKDWAVKNLIVESHNVRLRVPKVGEWEVSCRWTSQLQCQLRPRWPLFVKDNNLEEHDVCVFKLVSKGVVPVFDVHIFRVVDKIVKLKKMRA